MMDRRAFLGALALFAAPRAAEEIAECWGGTRARLGLAA